MCGSRGEQGGNSEGLGGSLGEEGLFIPGEQPKKGYGSHIGKGGAHTLQFEDKDNNGIDDRYQTEPSYEIAGYGSANYDPATVTSAQRMWIRHHSGASVINDREKLKNLYDIINQRA